MAGTLFSHWSRAHSYHRGSITFLMFVARFIIFDLQESSKYLIAKGRDEEALAVSLVFLVFDGLPLSSTACRVW